MTKPSRRIAVLSKCVDRDALEELIAPLPVEIIAGGEADLYVVDDPSVPPKNEIQVFPSYGVNAVFDAAGRVRRWLRAVPDAERCRSPGLDGLLSAGIYRHPDPWVPEPGTAEGVLLVKPGWVLTPSLLAELDQRTAECGYAVSEGRIVETEEVNAHGLARQHYLPHTELAQAGTLTVHERARMLAIYDQPEFRARFGVDIRDVPVMPAFAFMERYQVPNSVMRDWSDGSAKRRGLNSGALDGPNEVGDYLFVNVFHDPRFADGKPVLLVNPHMSYVLDDFCQPGTQLLALHLRARSREALSWARMRSEYCGRTDPQKALPGSLRGDAARGLLPLLGRDGERVSRTNNGIHLSNGAVEALREQCIWFGHEPAACDLGRAFVEAGLDPNRLLAHPFLRHLGRRRVVAEVTHGCDVREAVRLIRQGRLERVDQGVAGTPSLRRIDLAMSLARDLRSRWPGVLAVLATGSVAHARASADSDQDLIVIVEDSAQAHIEMERVEDIQVEINLLTARDVEELLDESRATDLKRLREASRLGTAVPLFDPTGLAEELAARAAAMRPPAAVVEPRIRDLLSTMMDLLLGQPEDPAARWEVLRNALDNAAIAMLCLSPLRYQKAKWVVDDLDIVGEADLRDLLLLSYGAEAADPESVLASGRRFLDLVASTTGRPDYRQVIAMGFAPKIPFFSYTCRTMADAQSLFADGRRLDAVYTARFAARLGVMAWAEGRGQDFEGSLTSELLADPTCEPIRTAYATVAGLPPTPPTEELLARASEVLIRCRRTCMERLA